eukprot:5216551-Amphidinium_carterae.1
MQRMSARLQTAEQTAADARARVQQAEQTANAAADRATAAERQQVAAGGHSTRLVDTRSLGRPREFKSLSGVAITKLQNVEVHNGLEAWRQLVLEFEPRTAGRRRLHLTSLLRPAKPCLLGATRSVSISSRSLTNYRRTQTRAR